MINYSNSIIYKICCNDPTVKDEYIGSTTNFRNRKWQHKYSCNKLNNEKYNRRLYVFIRETGGWLNWSMIEIEKYDATDKRHLETRERYWIEELKSSLNNYIPTRTWKEYRQDNKEHIKQYIKQYQQDNTHRYIEKIIQRRSQKYDCECGGRYTYANKQSHLRTAKCRANR
tara:strand:+ start:1040 stop:1552 length:513 start_codon:yes stop_codon:yes gene_type:complete